MNYKASDLGVRDIAPFSKVKTNFTQTIADGQGIRFSVSNQDSKQKAWVELSLLTSNGSSVLDRAPAEFVMYSYDPTNNTLLSPYIYSRSGKTNIKPL